MAKKSVVQKKKVAKTSPAKKAIIKSTPKKKVAAKKAPAKKVVKKAPAKKVVKKAPAKKVVKKVDAERNPRPHYWEAAKVFQFIKVLPEDMALGKIRIRNGYDFISLERFDADWVLEADGRMVAEGKLDKIDLAPGAERVVTVPWNGTAMKPGMEHYLTIRFRLAGNESWAGAGHVVAWEQLAVPAPPSAIAGNDVAAGVPFRKLDGDWVAEANGTSVRIDGRKGWLKSLKLSGHEILTSPVKPSFWRVPIDNDVGWKTPKLMGAWKDAVDKATLLSLAPGASPGMLAARLKLATGHCEMTYVLHADGALRVEMALDPSDKAPELPRVGMHFAIPGGMNGVQWFGRGPHENYQDRKSGAAIGIHQSTVNEWITPYVRPQENANRSDVRWIEFSGDDGIGLADRSRRAAVRCERLAIQRRGPRLGDS